jgi:hypothetical protein
MSHFAEIYIGLTKGRDSLPGNLSGNIQRMFFTERKLSQKIFQPKRCVTSRKYGMPSESSLSGSEYWKKVWCGEEGETMPAER